MEHTAQHLLETLEKALPLLHQISDAEAIGKTATQKMVEEGNSGSFD
jgi:hypothetical protein